ncbi:MAG: patatin-like phospholipase family protein [Steroidobacteraceae bacterium]
MALPLVASASPAATTGAIEPSPARPRIGLVLSGGGARGMAHIGVLRQLEDMRVPIDAIAGTSMGAVIGGLYASGLDAREIEAVMTSVNWQDAVRDRPPRQELTFRRKAEDQNFLVKFPLGLRGGDFKLPKGLIQGQKLTQLLRGLTLPVFDAPDFDALPTPFRAVATDLETGEAVILDSGDLTQAMRASLSAPGLFAPVERDGRLLVDGGIAENLPIDVARSLGVDVLIVVDVGFPLLPRQRLDSVPTISNQMLAIFIRRNAERQRRTLGEQDIVIDPALGEASSFDFGQVEQAIDLGRAAAREQGARLAALSLDDAGYARWVAARAAPREAPPVIDYVTAAAGSERYAATLQARFGDLAGSTLDAAVVADRVSRLYGQGNLELLDYRIEHDGARHGLALEARRNSWGPNYVRFGLNLQDDFDGNSSFNAAARFVLAELTERGAEWVWDLQVGESPRVATELFVPLDDQSRWFVMPLARVELRNVPLLEDGLRIAEYRVRSFQFGVDAGRELGDFGELRIGLRRESVSSRVRLGDPLLPVDDFNLRQYFARFSYDRLDDVNFPRAGQSFALEWRGERPELGSSGDAEVLSADWLVAGSRGRNTAVFWASAGSNIGDPAGTVSSLFPLGGFLNLSGLPPDSITGEHFAIARTLLYRQIGRGGEGFLNVPAYLGLSLELGNVWQRRSDISAGSAQRHGSVFLGLDTLFGPVYLGTGFSDAGDTGFYLFLGRTF